MLSISRKPKQSFQIGDDIAVTITDIKGKEARISIDTPKDLKIIRDDVKRKA